MTVISVQSLPQDSPLIDELREAGIPTASLALTKWTPWRAFSLSKFIRQFQPDIVHAHLIHAYLIARLNSRKRTYKLLNTVHTTELRRGKNWHFALDRATLSLCDCITAVSKSVQKFHSSKLAIAASKMPVVYNGITLPRQLDSQEITSQRQKWGVAHCAKIIGSVGRLEPEKGYDILLGMLDELARAIPGGEHWGIVILGEGRQRQKLELLCKQCPENITVRLPGFSITATESISAFDVFVMPSRFEGFGLALAEAMAHGIAVLANDIEALRELIYGYENGKLIPFSRENSQQICQTLVEMAHWRIVRGCRKFSKEKMVRAYLELYRG